MQLRVGQKVRYLRDTGEGVITNIIDNRTVEVDFGDDFPIPVEVRELVAVDQQESGYLGSNTDEEKSEKAPRVFGIDLRGVSLAICPSVEERFDLILINPEPSALLFTFFIKQNNKYSGQAHGQVDTGEQVPLLRLSRDELLATRRFHFQVLPFKSGRGHPQTPWTAELSWSKGRMMEPRRQITFLEREGWLLPLQQSSEEKQVAASLSDENLREVIRTEEPLIRKETVVDLHIEELVKNPASLTPTQMLDLQMRRAEEVMSEAIVNHYAAVIFIHGVGSGTLKGELHNMLKANHHVRKFEPADLAEYGNGATEVFFR